MALTLCLGQYRFNNLYGLSCARTMTRENVYVEEANESTGRGFFFYVWSIALLGLPSLRSWQIDVLFGDQVVINDADWPGFRVQLEKEWSSATVIVS